MFPLRTSAAAMPGPSQSRVDVTSGFLQLTHLCGTSASVKRLPSFLASSHNCLAAFFLSSPLVLLCCYLSYLSKPQPTAPWENVSEGGAQCEAVHPPLMAPLSSELPCLPLRLTAGHCPLHTLSSTAPHYLPSPGVAEASLIAWRFV